MIAWKFAFSICCFFFHFYFCQNVISAFVGRRFTVNNDSVFAYVIDLSLATASNGTLVQLLLLFSSYHSTPSVARIYHVSIYVEYSYICYLCHLCNIHHFQLMYHTNYKCEWCLKKFREGINNRKPIVTHPNSSTKLWLLSPVASLEAVPTHSFYGSFLFTWNLHTFTIFVTYYANYKCMTSKED